MLRVRYIDSLFHSLTHNTDFVFEGYIGGTAHAAIAKAHPDWEFTLLVRSEERAKPIKEAYPNTKFAYGGLDDADLVQKAAAEADIIVRMYSPILDVSRKRKLTETCQTQPILQIMKQAQRTSPKASLPATRQTSLATGSTHLVPPF